MSKRSGRRWRWWLWAARPASWVQIITCAGVLGGLLWTGVHYYTVDRPLSEASIKQILLDVELGAERRAEMSATARMADATAADLSDPVRAKISAVQLRTAQLQEAREVDELLSSITPDLRIKRGEAAEVGSETLLELAISNEGQRATVVDKVIVDVTGTGGAAGAGRRVTARLEACNLGLMAPRATKGCILAIPNPQQDEYEKVAYRVRVIARTDANTSGRSVQLLSEGMSSALVKARLSRTFQFDGIWLFDY